MLHVQITTQTIVHDIDWGELEAAATLVKLSMIDDKRPDFESSLVPYPW